jgi:pimeloyl-ACP methyl ester carboxylesterase
VLLLHGWPDDATTFADVAPSLQAAGFRTFAPWLRGFGKTSFHSDETMRSGEIAAMAQDALDFADASASNGSRLWAMTGARASPIYSPPFFRSA